MKTIALYPGTFDPITNGHSDIVRRAASLFDKVIVAIADTSSTTKSTLFSVDERVSLAKTVLSHLDNVEVCSFDKLATDKAKEVNANIIIRGLRAVSDFEYEFQMASMNRKLYPDAETVFLTPPEHLTYTSSSLIRQIAQLGGDVSDFVDAAVIKALKNKN